MFIGATSFNQSLPNWDVGKGENFIGMFDNTAISQDNWDITLIGWHAQHFTTISNKTVGAGGLNYCHAEKHRTSMQNEGFFVFDGDRRRCNSSSVANGINYMRHGKRFFNGSEIPMEFGKLKN